jgi:hypothetical protein
VLDAHWEQDRQARRPVRHIDRVALEHVALCRPGAAANPDTWLGAATEQQHQNALHADAPDSDTTPALALGSDTTPVSADTSSDPASSHDRTAQVTHPRPRSGSEGGDGAACEVEAGETADGQTAAAPDDDSAHAPDSEAAQVEDAVLASLGSALVQMWRRLWPRAADADEAVSPVHDADMDADTEAETASPVHDADAEAEAGDDMRESPPHVDGARESAEGAEDGQEARAPEAPEAEQESDTQPQIETVTPGRPQSLPGQIGSANLHRPHSRGTEIWKGVL